MGHDPFPTSSASLFLARLFFSESRRSSCPQSVAPHPGAMAGPSRGSSAPARNLFPPQELLDDLCRSPSFITHSLLPLFLSSFYANARTDATVLIFSLFLLLLLLLQSICTECSERRSGVVREDLISTGASALVLRG